MTFRDLLSRMKPEDYDKVIIYKEGKGWTNIDVEVDETSIIVSPSSNSILSEDK